MLPIEGVEWEHLPGKLGKNGNVRIGMQLPSKQRELIKMRKDELPEVAVTRDREKFSRVKALVDALAGTINE